MSRWMILTIVSLWLTTTTGCPPEMGESQRAEPGTEGPTTGGDLLEGPGFSLALPNGITLREQDSPHAAVSYWRYYLEDSGQRAITVQVIQAGLGVSNLEQVQQRVKGSVRSSFGDFLLVSRIAASGPFAFETEAAVGRLANGDILVVQVASPAINGTDELIALSVFTSIDLKGTDGSALETTWRESSPRLVARVGADTVVLSDGSVWQLYSDKTSAEEAEAGRWNIEDAIATQILSTEDDTDHGELVHVGRWLPVPMFKLATATESAVSGIGKETVDLSDGTSWVIGASAVEDVKRGDPVFQFLDQGRLFVVLPSSNRVVSNPAKSIVTDRFRAVLPSGAHFDIADFPPPPGAEFSTLTTDSDGVGFGVFVVPTRSGGSSFGYENTQIRLLGSVETASGDFLFAATITQDEFEAIASIGRLSDGSTLLTMVVSDTIDAAVEAKADTLFRSISLLETTGRSLEEEVAAESESILVKGDNGMAVLSDLSVWSLKFSPAPTDVARFGQLSTGDSVILQAYSSEFALEEVTEIFQVGNWSPIRVKSDGVAKRTTIAEIIGANQMRLADGSTWTFATPVPANWNIGDEVFRATDSILSEWLILRKTGRAIEFF